MSRPNPPKNNGLHGETGQNSPETETTETPPEPRKQGRGKGKVWRKSAFNLTRAHAGVGGKPAALQLNSAVRRRTAWRKMFLETLRSTGIQRLACEAANVAPGTVQRARLKCARFARAYEQACSDANELIEAHILKRATTGEPEGVWLRDKSGNPVRVETIYRKSDRLLELLAKSRMLKYRETHLKAELTGANGAPLQSVIAPVQVQIVIPDNGRNDIPAQSAISELPAPSAPVRLADAVTRPENTDG
jgi:hypothetical protein